MHLLQHKLCTRKTELALKMRFYLDFHWVYMTMAMNTGQRKWRQMCISMVSERVTAGILYSRCSDTPSPPFPPPLTVPRVDTDLLSSSTGKPLVTDSTDSAFFSADHLPFKVPHFCGRNAIVDEIVALVSEQEQHTVVMIAPPGFGKSAVVTHVGHTLLERKLASVLYVSLRQRKSLSEVCSDIARCCGQESTPGGGNDPVLLAQDLLSNLQHRTVLILDNAEDLQDSPDTEKFARFIDYLGSHVKRLCVLLTTRQELVIPYLDIHRIQLPALGPKVAANLLSKLTKNSSARWSELGELCGGVPLYLSIAASQLNNGLNARVLIGQLRKKGLAGVLRSPDSSLEVCYNSLLVFFKQIKKNLLVSLVQLAVFPTSFTVTDVCFLFKERFDCELALSNLVKNALLQRTSDGSSRRYELHPLIQSFCKTERKSLGLESEGNKAEKLFIQHHLKLLQDLHREFVSNDGCQNAMENFYQKKVNILHALKESLETSQPSNKIKQLALDVCTEVVNFLAKALGPADFYDLYDQCQKAADRLSDVVRQSDCQVSLGFHYLLDVNHGKMSKEAEDCFQNAQELRNSIPLTPRRCQEREAYTHGLSKLGLCQVLRGSVEDGRELILKALRKRRERADHLMEAAGYCDLACKFWIKILLLSFLLYPTPSPLSLLSIQTFSFPLFMFTWAQKVYSPNLSKSDCMSDVARICSIITFHLSKLWKVTFSILCDVIFLVRLQGKFDIDH